MGLDSLFGMELSLPVKAIVAFAVVLALLAIVTWAFRRVGGERLGTPAGRGGRQPRLGVIDAAAVDSRRRLVLIRRDNVEHLIMIGGPTDVVVEQNIVRAVPVAPPREPPGARQPPAEPLARAPTEALSRSPVEGMRPVSSPEIAPRALSPRPDSPDRAGRSFEPRRAPRPDAGREPLRPPRAAAASRSDLEPPIEVHPAPPTSDANLADMAQRLEAALRRPGAARDPLSTTREALARDPLTKEGRPAEQAGAPSSPEGPAPTATQPAADADMQTKPPTQGRADAKPAQPKSVLDSLEEEMASLLGRPEKKE